jgi:hypothetical protein
MEKITTATLWSSASCLSRSDVCTRARIRIYVLVLAGSAVPGISANATSTAGIGTHPEALKDADVLPIRLPGRSLRIGAGSVGVSCRSNAFVSMPELSIGRREFEETPTWQDRGSQLAPSNC